METIVTLNKVYLFLGVFLSVCILVIIAIMLDLWDGVYKARKTGQRVHSHKLRVTIAKMSEYWRFIMIGFLMDCPGILFSFYLLPFMTILFGLGLIGVEWKSMFEHAKRRKSHTTQLPDVIRSIIDCVHEADARKIIERMSETTNKEN